MFKSLTLALALAVALPLAAGADDISDNIDKAAAAYADNDPGAALAALQLASRGLIKLKSDAMAALLPDAPAGWTRTLTPDLADGLAMMGGGAGAEATYQKDDVVFTLSLMSGVAMMDMMLPMFQDEGMLAMMGTVTKLGDVSIVDQDGSVMSVIGGKVMLSASGAASDVMLPVIKTIDFDAVAKLGS